ncbi:MAG: hypothetical protein GF308_14425 [Candidatus Heimdallarchaeota archaeon]|nr:hypothetical protein [Candidatus Heimdallarchaeota archaeon]
MATQVLYSAIQQSEFFDFFNCHEINSITLSSSLVVKKVKPGGFQEYIDLEFHLKGDEIEKAQLILDRSWIGDQKHVNPFAKDITKSFIATIVPSNEKHLVESLVEHLFRLKGYKDIVYYIHQKEPLPSPSSEILQVVDVFLGNKPSTKFLLARSYFQIENQVQNEESYFSISWLNVPFNE